MTTKKLPKKQADTLSDTISKVLEDSKATDIVIINLNGKSDVADAIMIATGTSSKHVHSIASNVMLKLKSLGEEAAIEGLSNSDWVLVDTGDIVVHIFKQETRELYNLEKIYANTDVITNEH